MIDSLLLDSSDIEATGVVRFRVTDADHDLPVDGITVSNLSIATPSPVVAFYAGDQISPEGNWGWFVVELPLVNGDNVLEFCAEDGAGNVFGTTEEPCVVATVVRESPVAFAVVTEPIGDLIEARLGEVVPIDGSASVVPPGGVGLWTMGERTTYLGYPWMQRATMAPTSDFGELQTVALMPGEPPLGFRARLVVAASLDDLPAELWPEDGSLPCSRSEGEGRCDAVDVRFDLQCNRDPDLASWSWTSPRRRRPSVWTIRCICWPTSPSRRRALCIPLAGLSEGDRRQAVVRHHHRQRRCRRGLLGGEQ